MSGAASKATASTTCHLCTAMRLWPELVSHIECRASAATQTQSASNRPRTTRSDSSGKCSLYSDMLAMQSSIVNNHRRRQVSYSSRRRADIVARRSCVRAFVGTKNSESSAPRRRRRLERYRGIGMGRPATLAAAVARIIPTQRTHRTTRVSHSTAGASSINLSVSNSYPTSRPDTRCCCCPLVS